MPNDEQDAIRHMFDRIATTYDSVNHVLSFGFDSMWRKRVCALISKAAPLTVLDIATGTADLLIALCETHAHIVHAYGVDISENMLRCGHEKIARHPLRAKMSLQNADACALPFESESIDVISNAFGIRNMPAIDRAISEMYRVLKPDGLALVLEFSLPPNWILRQIYLCYFRFILPTIGGIISKDKDAYRYLNRTVESFLTPSALCEKLRGHGFNRIDTVSLTFGIATIYCVRKK